MKAIYLKRPQEYKAIMFDGTNESEIMHFLKIAYIEIQLDWEGTKILIIDKKRIRKSEWVVVKVDHLLRIDGDFEIMKEEYFKNGFHLKKEDLKIEVNVSDVPILNMAKELEGVNKNGKRTTY